MEENKGIKVNLKTAVMLIIILVIALIVAVAVIFKLREQKIVEPEPQNTTTPSITRVPQPTTIQPTEFKENFATSFLQMENENKNMVYSPLSIKYALNMLNEGANGKTKTQIENILKNVNLPKYNNINKVLSLANATYIRDTYKQYVIDDYKNTLMGKYNAEVIYDKFKNAKNVNDWIENKTLGIIKNMLSDELVQDPNMEMLLINALAIDMEWESPFECKDTYGKEFKLADGSTMNATTLQKKTSSDDVLYYKDENITALTMNLQKYDDTQLEFTAIMPNNNLSDYISTFSTEELNSITKKLKPASSNKYGIDIEIPKFSFDYNLKLKKDLMQLGITEAFSETDADFTNMTNNPMGLYVNDALHKANIDFTEKGVKAAAVTVIVMFDKAAMIIEEPEEVKFDKPFLYVIRDKSNGEIWFLGTVYKPNSWEDEKAEYEKNMY